MQYMHENCDAMPIFSLRFEELQERSLRHIVPPVGLLLSFKTVGDDSFLHSSLRKVKHVQESWLVLRPPNPHSLPDSNR